MLDTNVVSALISPHADPRLDAWLAQRTGEPAIVPVVVIAEIRFGIDLLPHGRRRSDLETRFESVLRPGGGVAVAPVDGAAANRAGAYLALRRRLGRPATLADMMIAGEHGAAIATRNVRDFEGLGLTLHDPWAP